MARRPGVCATVALIAALAASFATRARAQEPAPDPASARCAEARELFEQGTDAVDAGRLAEGRDLLRSAADLCPIVQVWFNLGFALRRSGFTTEAIGIFDALLRGQHGELTPEQQTAIREELEGARREVAIIRLAITPPGPAEVALDGRVYGTAPADRPLMLRTDAGSHVVAATRENASGEARVQVTRGQVLDLRLELEERDEGGIPIWVWIAGGSVIAAALVVTIVILTLPEPLPSAGMIIPT